MRITIDTLTDNDETIRAAIGFLIHLRPALSADIEVPEGTSPPKVNTAAPGLTAAASAGALAAANTTTTTPSAPMVPAPASNVVNFPVPPPPPSVNTAAPTTPAAPATSAAAVGTVVSGAPAEYDSAGMPWDARIHQKAKGKKKDGTWKLIKGIDEATVQTVTVELSARKIATPQSPTVGVTPGTMPVPSVPLPPPPPGATIEFPNLRGAVPPPPATVAPQVFLPPGDTAPSASVGGGNPVPLPSQPGNAAATDVPAQTVASSVPVPPITPAGAVGGGSNVTAVSYRSIIDKMTAGTRENKLTAAKVLEIVINCGCPNLQQLNQMPNVWADVDAKIDLALAGLL